MAFSNPYADFMKQFSEYKMPAFDMNSLFSVQRRNVEAFSAANQLMAESVQAITRRQAEVMRTSMEGMMKASKDVMSSGSPEASSTKQADYAKSIMEESLTNMREISEMAAKSSFEAFDMLNKRTSESIEELNQVVSKAA
jgi:phasin family protein